MRNVGYLFVILFVGLFVWYFAQEYLTVIVVAGACIILILALIQIFKNKARRAKLNKYGQRKGKEGELAVSSELLKLSKEYRVFNDINFSCSGALDCVHYQVDHIVVSRYGIFVIETKNFNNCKVRRFNNEYLIASKSGHADRKFFNPIAQNEKHIGGLKSALGSYDYFSLVVFAGNASLVDLGDENGGFIGHISCMNKYIATHSRAIYTNKQVGEIVAKINAINITSLKLRREHDNRIKKKYAA